MVNKIHRKMNSIQLSSSILVLLITLSEAIRVDWNTNKGPIVPPIPTQQPRPQPPYREPASVWEDQSDDTPNPNPYRYVLPPPSRPRPPVDNYLRAPLYSISNTQQQKPNYGQVISNQNNYQSNIVPSLGVQYIPNVGYKYSAVVPQKSYYLQQNDIYDHKYEKQNGRYNAKLKKYKAYEDKLKYTSQNYQQQQLPQANQYQFAVQQQQQLPFLQAPQPFRPSTNFHQQQQLPLQQNPIPFNSQITNNSKQQQINNGKRDVKQQTEQNEKILQWTQQQQLPQPQQSWQQQQNWQSIELQKNLGQTAPQTFFNPTQQTFSDQQQQVKTSTATSSSAAQKQNLRNENNSKQS